MSQNKKHILIANLGSASLYAKGLDDETLYGVLPEDAFKKHTQELKNNKETKFLYQKGNKNLKNQYEQSCKIENVYCGIIPHIIKYFKDDEETNFTEVRLFCSDQVGEAEERRKKDTCFAAEIIIEHNLIAKTLKEELDFNPSDFKVHQDKFNCAIHQLDKLFKAYENEIIKLKNIYPQGFFVLCDTGGSPQQRWALRLAAEYQLPKESYAYYRVLEKVNTDGSVNFAQCAGVEREPERYTEIMTLKQILLLIDKGQYLAAKMTWDSFNPVADTNKYSLSKMLELMHLRVNLRFKDYEVAADGLKQFKEETRTELSSLLPEQFFTIEYNNEVTSIFDSLLNPKQYYKLREHLSVVDWYRRQEAYSQVVLYWQTFLEQYLKFGLEFLSGLDLSDDYGKDMLALNMILKTSNNQLRAEVKPEERTWTRYVALWRQNSEKKTQENKDALEAFYNITDTQVHNKFLRLLEFVNINGLHEDVKHIKSKFKILSSYSTEKDLTRFHESLRSLHNDLGVGAKTENTGINHLRNRQAHTGKGVTKEELDEALPSWEEELNKQLAIFGLKTEENLYLQLNEELSKFIKENREAYD